MSWWGSGGELSDQVRRLEDDYERGMAGMERQMDRIDQQRAELYNENRKLKLEILGLQAEVARLKELLWDKDMGDEVRSDG